MKSERELPCGGALPGTDFPDIAVFTPLLVSPVELEGLAPPVIIDIPYSFRLFPFSLKFLVDILLLALPIGPWLPYFKFDLLKMC